MKTLCNNSSYDNIERALTLADLSLPRMILTRNYENLPVSKKLKTETTCDKIKQNYKEQCESAGNHENLTILKELKTETTGDKNNLDDKEQCESAWNQENLTVLKQLKTETTSGKNNLNGTVQCESAGNTELFKFEDDYGNLFQIENVRSLSEYEHAAFEVLEEISVESKSLKRAPVYFKNEDKVERKHVESSNNAKDSKTLTNLPEIVIGKGGAPVYLSDHKSECKCPLCFRPLKEVKKLHHNIEMMSSKCDCGLVIYQDLSIEDIKSRSKTENYTKEPHNKIGYKLSDGNYSLEPKDFKAHHKSSSVENIKNQDKIDNKDANCASELKNKDINLTLDFKSQHQPGLEKCKEKLNPKSKDDYSDKKYDWHSTSKLKKNKEMEVKGIYNKTDCVAKIKVEDTKNCETKILQTSCSTEEVIPEYCKSFYVVQDKNENGISEPKTSKKSRSPEEAISESFSSFYVIQDKTETGNSSLTMHMKMKDIVCLAVNKKKRNNENKRKVTKADSLQCASVTKDKQIEGGKLKKTSNKNKKNMSKNITISKRKCSDIDRSLNDVTERINNVVSGGEKQKFIRKKYTKMKNNEKKVNQKSKAIKRNHEPVVKNDSIDSELNGNVQDINNNNCSSEKNKKTVRSLPVMKKNLKQPKLELKKLEIKKKNKSALKCAALKIPRIKIEKLDEKVNMSLNCKYKKNYRKMLKGKDVKTENSSILKKKKKEYAYKKEINRKTLKGKDVKIENSSFFKKKNEKHANKKEISRNTLNGKEVKIESSIILKKRDEEAANKKEMRCSSRQRMKPFCFPAYDGRGQFIHQDIWGSMSARELEICQIKLKKLE